MQSLNIKKRLQRYYEIKRTNAEQDHEEYLRLLYQKHPKLQEFDQKRMELSLDKIKASVRNNEKQVNYFSNEINKLDQQLADFLLENDIPSDYELITYTCSFCQDTGWYEDEHCVCINEALKVLNKQDNLFAPPENMVFATFNADLFSGKREKEYFSGKISPQEAIQGMRNIFGDFVDQFEQSSKSFFLFGSPGTGKTFMMASVANALREKGVNVIFLKAVRLFEIMAQRRTLLNSFKPDPVEQDTVKHFLSLIQNAEFLCIDDLGLEARLLNTYADFIVLLDERINKNLSTMITSNLRPKELADEYDERISSRIIGSYDLNLFEGRDIRKEIAKNRKMINRKT